MISELISPNLSNNGMMNAVFCISSIVLVLYKNCDHVWKSFGRLRIFDLREGNAEPFNSTLNFEQCLALASIAVLTLSLSYSEPSHDVNTGRYAVNILNCCIGSLFKLSCCVLLNKKSNKPISNSLIVSQLFPNASVEL